MTEKTEIEMPEEFVVRFEKLHDKLRAARMASLDLYDAAAEIEKGIWADLKSRFPEIDDGHNWIADFAKKVIRRK